MSRILSLSSWRAWIEIDSRNMVEAWVDRSLSSWRAWIEMLLSAPPRQRYTSLSSWRAWIEIALPLIKACNSLCGRSPHGERGLKYRCHESQRVENQSLSSWRAWIEIPMTPQETHGLTSRSPHGERGLKYIVADDRTVFLSRSPHGERGLKWLRNNRIPA